MAKKANSITFLPVLFWWHDESCCKSIDGVEKRSPASERASTTAHHNHFVAHWELEIEPSSLAAACCLTKIRHLTPAMELAEPSSSLECHARQ